MVQEAPDFHSVTNEERGEISLKGRGELHLDIKADILRRTHGVEVEVGEPQVAYRESITKRLEDNYVHKKQSGGSGQFAKIGYIVEPGEVGSGFVFESKVTGGSVPREYWPAVQKGFQSCIDVGVLAGFPCLDLKFTLVDGGFHPVDSSAMAFEIAAKAAYRQSVPKAGPQLLEPIMNVDVFTPDDHMGDVIGDLNRRRGTILGMESRGSTQVVRANVPLAETFGYVNELRSMTSGRASYSMEFAYYDPVPRNVAEEIIAKKSSR